MNEPMNLINEQRVGQIQNLLAMTAVYWYIGEAMGKVETECGINPRRQSDIHKDHKNVIEKFYPGANRHHIYISQRKNLTEYSSQNCIIKNKAQVSVKSEHFIASLNVRCAPSVSPDEFFSSAKCAYSTNERGHVRNKSLD